MDVLDEYITRRPQFERDDSIQNDGDPAVVIDGLDQYDKNTLFAWFTCVLHVHTSQLTLEDVHVPAFDEKKVFPGEVVLSFSDPTYYGYLQVLLSQPPTTLTYFLGKCIQYGISNTKTNVNYRGILDELDDVCAMYAKINEKLLNDILRIQLPEIIKTHTHDVIDYGLDETGIENWARRQTEIEEEEARRQEQEMNPVGIIKGTPIGGKTRKRKVKKSRKTRRSSYSGTKKKFTFKHKTSKK